MRAKGGHAREVVQEKRQHHLQDILGMWVAATRAFRTAAERIVAKHRETCEYEIQTGLALMLRLEDRRLFDPCVSARLLMIFLCRNRCSRANVSYNRKTWRQHSRSMARGHREIGLLRHRSGKTD